MILPGYSPAQCYGHANLPTGGKVEGGYDKGQGTVQCNVAAMPAFTSC
jgi:hypothetical protein